ncbi:MAG: ABC transporter permease [Helicobacteraceae bacterium]|jgi:putative ABC transport system permease protein|nr:ABC transporter permease [Helicobacteraceae bacterium]
MRLGYLLTLAAKSAWNRRGTLSLVAFSIALSTALLLGVERIRTQVKESFVQTISGTDLIVGSRGGDIQLMLYAAFHIGSATNNMSWQSAEAIAARSDVAWTIPVSLGDSHRGYPVVATNLNFFERYKFRGDRNIAFADGAAFADLFDAVLGAETAKRLKYKIGDQIVLSHGESQTKLAEHNDKPFRIAGILAPTGTTLDRSLYISLEAMEALHIDWQGGAPIQGFNVSPEQARKFNLEPKNITALLVGLKKRAGVFALQRDIGAWKIEPLIGVMPGVAMDKIWRMSSALENALMFVSVMVTITGLAGLISAILAGLNERRLELAVLRSAGARPFDIVALLAFEALLLTLIGIICGGGALTALIAIFSPILANSYGVALYLSAPSASELMLTAAILVAGFCAGLIPAIKAYRISLSDGLSIAA